MAAARGEGDRAAGAGQVGARPVWGGRADRVLPGGGRGVLRGAAGPAPASQGAVRAAARLLRAGPGGLGRRARADLVTRRQPARATASATRFRPWRLAS